MAVAVAAPVAALAEPSQGPLGVRTAGTLRDLFLDVVQWDARAVTALRLDVGWSMANDWSTPTTLTRDGAVVQVRLDEQSDSLTAAIRVPWGVVLGSPEGSFARRLSSALELRGTLHWGGWSDGVIDAWHKIFAYNDFARPAFPKNEVHLELRDPLSSQPVDIQSTTFAFGDVVLRNQLLLWEGGEPLREGPEARAGVSLRLDVKVPTGVALPHGRLGRLGRRPRGRGHLAGHLLAGRSRHRGRLLLVGAGRARSRSSPAPGTGPPGCRWWRWPATGPSSSRIAGAPPPSSPGGPSSR